MKVMTVFLFLLVFGLAFALQAREIPRCEHPRPDLVRVNWQCLNGEWEFQYDRDSQGEAEKWMDKERLSDTIVVPFEIESIYSGVKDKKPPNYFWYKTRFKLQDNLKGPGKLILHFEAVDYRAWVWLNGKFLGEHTGGYTAFSFDVTAAANAGDNTLTVRVFDSNDQKQARGKQSSTGKGYAIWYTPVSGIWQPVWIERVGDTYIKNFKAYPDLSAGQVKFDVAIENPKPGLMLSLVAIEPDGKEIDTWLKKIPLAQAASLVWKLKNPRLWSHEHPDLYKLKFLVQDEKGAVVDELESYLGVREVKVSQGKVLLNGVPVYQKQTLVQGYFQPGIYSPKSDSEFERDLRLNKEMGFNGLRMHQKVEAARYYYWADKLGVLIWQDMPALASEVKSQFVPVEKKYRDQFDKEWQEALTQLFNHPSIIANVPFNESWGIWAEVYSPSIKKWALDVVKLTRALDPTRPVVDNSGWLHRDTDILDVHHYVPTVDKSEVIYNKLAKPWGTYTWFTSTLSMAISGAPIISPLFWGVKYQGQPIVISEYGGFGFYKSAAKSLLDNYRDYTLAIGKYPYIQGYCYTQEYDVEQEQNGLLNPDRTPKVPVDEIKKINDQVGT